MPIIDPTGASLAIATPSAVVFGASGTIGSALCTSLKTTGYAVTAVVRDPEAAKKHLPGLDRYLSPELTHPAILIEAMEGATAICNFSGSPLFSRPFRSLDPTIRTSRVQLTTEIVRLLSQTVIKPGVLINASAIGYYGSHEYSDQPLDESAAAGGDSQALLVSDWENAALDAQLIGIRTVVIRTGLLLNRGKKGALAQLALPFTLGLGGPIGHPNSWRSWIHLEDEIGLILWAIAHQGIEGPLNATSPCPLTNWEFSGILGASLNRPSWLRVPEPLVRLAFGERAETLTRGKRIIPQKAVASGYQFNYPDLTSALTNLLS